MANKRNKLTPNQQAYKKELQRINRAVSRAEKKGYIFDNDFIPQMPKRVTKKALQKIQDFKTPQIYKYSDKLDESTGELVQGKLARQLERQESAKKAQETRRRNQRLPKIQPPKETPIEVGGTNYPRFSDIVINNFKDTIRNFNPVVKEFIDRWMGTVIRTQGEDAFAQMLQESAERGIFIDYAMGYDAETARRVISRMLDFLPEIGELTRQELTDALEFDEDWELPN